MRYSLVKFSNWNLETAFYVSRCILMYKIFLFTLPVAFVRLLHWEYLKKSTTPLFSLKIFFVEIFMLLSAYFISSFFLSAYSFRFKVCALTKHKLIRHICSKVNENPKHFIISLNVLLLIEIIKFRLLHVAVPIILKQIMFLQTSMNTITVE